MEVWPMQPRSLPEVVVRVAMPDDSDTCGQICYEAFSEINTNHGFPCYFPSLEAAISWLARLFSDPGFYCLVAESGGRIVGSNCLDERSIIAGIGPVTVDPAFQNIGIGRRLMRAVMDRANARSSAGVRLLQAAYHSRSLGLYASMGFDVREPISCVQGWPREREIPGCAVRPAQPSDLETCNSLCRTVHGFDRSKELAQAIQANTPMVVERAGRVTGYATALAYWGHATAETNADLQALIASAESFGGPGILVPSRNNAVLRWCLANNLRIVEPVTLMSMGLYNEPAGAWLPSILF
jgi:predicted N-acetyltransferase YhbS